MRFPEGTHETYQLVVGDELDGLAEPPVARELVHLLRTGTTHPSTGEGMLEFETVEGSAGLGTELAVSRLIGSEQSNTSVVFDEEVILKVYRRLEAGINPELEMLRFLTEHGFEHVPPLGGWYAYRGRPLEATLGILQQFVAGGLDGWELALDELASAPDAFLARLRRLGEVTGEMHTVLASDGSDPELRARGAEPRGARAADRVDRRGDRACLPRAARRRRGARADPPPRRGRPRAPSAAHLRRRRPAR